MKTLIVGGGLAGLSIAHQLRMRNEDFQLVCDLSKPSSTAVATGMFNPIVFRHLNLSWMIDDLLPALHKFMDEVAAATGQTFESLITFKKRIPNEEYERLWESRQSDPAHSNYFGPLQNGHGRIERAGIVDCKKFQSCYLNLLKSENKLVDSTFIYDEIDLTQDSPTWKNHNFSRIIFCEGAFAIHNPLFNWLPFNICKGQWIVIKTEEHLTEEVINNKINIIPMGNLTYKLSSTYRWNNLNWDAEVEPEGELIKNFREVFDVPFKIIDRAAGLRPTVADRRPYLGEHPTHKNLFIFNGLGSKGVMLAPFFSDHLIRHVLDGFQLIPEVNISRHIKRFDHPHSI